VYELVIDLWVTSYVFKKGNIVRVEISSSEFDRYDRNLNTGAAPGFSDQMVKAEQTIHHSEAHPSRIILPVRE
jgi:predicted acyl esterase